MHSLENFDNVPVIVKEYISPETRALMASNIMAGYMAKYGAEYCSVAAMEESHMEVVAHTDELITALGYYV